jgi:hypothetical protein
MNNKLIAAAVTLTIVLFATISFNIVLDKIADRVIEKLKRDYVPGPYSPGFDPDKVDPSAFSSMSIPLTLNEIDFPTNWTEQVFENNDLSINYSSKFIGN